MDFPLMDQRFLSVCFLDFKSVIPCCVVYICELDFVGLNYFSEKRLNITDEFFLDKDWFVTKP